MEQYLPVLENCPFFAGLTAAEILSSLQNMDARLVRRESGVFLLRSGEQTEQAGLLLSGSAWIFREDLWGHRSILAGIQAGDLYAEAYAAVPGAVSGVSVMTREDSDILLLPLGQLLTASPSGRDACSCLVRNLVSVFSRKLLVLNDKIAHMSQRSTREKLLSYLSAESLRQGSLTIDIPYDRQQLADYLCVDRSAMSVELSRLQKEGLLETHRRHFVLRRVPDAVADGK